MSEEKKGFFSAENISVSLTEGERRVKVLRDVSLSLPFGGCVGMVGESGCGKSLLCRALLGILPGRKWTVEGRAFLKGGEIPLGDDKEMDRFRGKCISMIVQNPMDAFDPRMTVEAHFLEGVHWRERGRMREKALRELERMRIREPWRVMKCYPFQLSGGMLQRVLIALSLLGGPEVLIADEPTTALDAAVQSEILSLLKGLQKERKLSILLVSHDLDVICGIADELSVMYAGEIVEQGEEKAVRARPLHPYTQGLFRSRLTFSKEKLWAMEGQPPAPGTAAGGCLFGPRCTVKKEICGFAPPPFREAEPGHFCRCWRVGEEHE